MTTSLTDLVEEYNIALEEYNIAFEEWKVASKQKEEAERIMADKQKIRRQIRSKLNAHVGRNRPKVVVLIPDTKKVGIVSYNTEGDGFAMISIEDIST